MSPFFFTFYPKNLHLPFSSEFPFMCLFSPRRRFNHTHLLPLQVIVRFALDVTSAAENVFFFFFVVQSGEKRKIIKCFSALGRHFFFLSAYDFTARTVTYADNKDYANPQQQQQQWRRLCVQIWARYLLCVMHSQSLPASPLKTANIRQFIRVHWGSRDKWGYLVAAQTQRIAQPWLGYCDRFIKF